VIGQLSKPALYRWYYDNGAQGRPFADKREADLGTCVHLLAESRRAGVEPDTHALPPDMVAHAKVLDARIAEWERRSEIQIECTEAELIDDDLRIGGTVDLVGTLRPFPTLVEPERWLIDIKTGSGVYDEVSIQLAAYRHLWNKHNPGRRIDRCGVLHAPAKGSGVALIPLSDENLDEGMRVFRSLVDVYYRSKSLRIEREAA
jgi:hypothetical protein